MVAGIGEQLAEHLNGFKSAPFLFVGSGMSRRYLGVETWASLLERFAAKTTHPYAYFVSKANGSLPRVATLIAEEFHDVWWSDSEYAPKHTSVADQLTAVSSPLKIEIAHYLAAAISNLPTSGRATDELALLRNAVIDGVITTNYDGLLEELFGEFKVFVGQDQLLFSDPQGVGEVYKIHGSQDVPNSLVLTEEDYAGFAERNPYLAAKLLAIFVEHPVIFLGYSLSDANITSILVSIAKCLTTANLALLQDRLVFVEWDPDVDEAVMTRTQIAVEGFSIPVLTVRVSDFVETFGALGTLQRKFPARLLRQLKEHVYDLVLTNEPSGRLFVQDIEDAGHIENVDVVFGVGMEERLSGRGYRGLDRFDLLMDVLASASQYDPERIVSEALPTLLRRPGNIPIFRYLREGGYLRQDGALKASTTVNDDVRERVRTARDRLQTPVSVRSRGERLLGEAGGSFTELSRSNTPVDTLQFLPLVPRSSVDLDELRGYLVTHEAFARGDDAYASSAWCKAVCLYDFYQFGLNAGHST